MISIYINTKTIVIQKNWSDKYRNVGIVESHKELKTFPLLSRMHTWTLIILTRALATLQSALIIGWFLVSHSPHLLVDLLVCAMTKANVNVNGSVSIPSTSANTSFIYTIRSVGFSNTIILLLTTKRAATDVSRWRRRVCSRRLGHLLT